MFDGEEDNFLQSLVAAYNGADAILAKLAKLPSASPHEHALELALQEFLSALLKCATRVPATTPAGVQAKLALWKADDVDFPLDPQGCNRAQLVLLSLVRDLIPPAHVD